MNKKQKANDQTLAARVVKITPLLYEEGADPDLDRPAHVRSASGIAWTGERFIVVQDDANFIALVENGGKVASVALPAGEAGKRQFDDERGNKKFKMDLESCALIPFEDRQLLITFGSGSNPHREKVVLLENPSGSPRPKVCPAQALYADLRSAKEFAGSELNIEGAIFLGDKIRLFNRGNGSSAEGDAPVNASCDLDWHSLHAYLTNRSEKPPIIENITRYELGTLCDVPLGFTDVTAYGDKLFFSAAAEDSPDAETDGKVAGSVLGVFDEAGKIRWTVISGADGKAFDRKAEGITFLGNDSTRLFVVVDQDSPDEPSELCEIMLSGSWF